MTNGVRSRRLLSNVAAWYVTDILKDAPPPASAKGGRIAYKTGTSYGYRDAWAIGFDGRYTIGVWVGRPDSAATPGLTGRTAAAPMLFDAFQRLSPDRVALAPAPSAALRATGANLPPPLKRFLEPGEIARWDTVGCGGDVSFGSASERVDTGVGGDAVEPGPEC